MVWRMRRCRRTCPASVRWKGTDSAASGAGSGVAAAAMLAGSWLGLLCGRG